MKLVTLTDSGFNDLMEMGEVISFITEKFPFFNDIVSKQAHTDSIALFKLCKGMEETQIFQKFGREVNFKGRLLTLNLFKVFEDHLTQEDYEKLIRSGILQEKDISFIDTVKYYQENDQLSLFKATVKTVNSVSYKEQLETSLEKFLDDKAAEIMPLLKSNNRDFIVQLLFILENYELLKEITYKPKTIKE